MNSLSLMFKSYEQGFFFFLGGGGGEGCHRVTDRPKTICPKFHFKRIKVLSIPDQEYHNDNFTYWYSFLAI